jgi:hypothetical protein
LRGGRHWRLVFLISFLIILDFAFNKGEDVSLPFEEVWMAEDIFAGILTTLVEAVHVELANEGVDVAMSEIFGEDLILELIDVSDGELAAVTHPVDDGLVLLVFQDLEALLNEVSDCVLIWFARHSFDILNFYSLKRIN